jgi:hypothetical protein
MWSVVGVSRHIKVLTLQKKVLQNLLKFEGIIEGYFSVTASEISVFTSVNLYTTLFKYACNRNWNVSYYFII